MEKAIKRDLALRELDPAIVAQQNGLLAACVEGMSVSRLEHGQRYVALAAQIDGIRCTAFAPTQQLIDHWLGEATLPADQMDDDITRTFMIDSFRQVGLPTPSPSVRWEGIKGIAQAQDYEKPLLLLQGGPFDIVLPHLPADFCASPAPPLPDLSIALRMLVGTLRLPACELVGLSTGDVIRIPPQPGFAQVADQSIFSFQIHGDYLMVDTTLDDMPDAFEQNGDTDRTSGNETDDAERDSESSDPGPSDHDVHINATESPHAGGSLPAEFAEQDAHISGGPIRVEDLPVTLSFVLSQCNLRVAEIGSLKPGMTLSLERPVPYVDVMAGSLRLARGELVRVGDDLGVEILDVVAPNTHTPGAITS